MCGKQRTCKAAILDVWQMLGLRTHFSYVWQGKGLGNISTPEGLNVGLVESGTQGAMRMVIKIKELREKQFVRI
jgi:hypothetical protein